VFDSVFDDHFFVHGCAPCAGFGGGLMDEWRNEYQFIWDIHSRNTRHGSNLYQPSTNLSLYQRGTCYMGIKIFNSLPPYLKRLHNNSILFKSALKNYLHTHSFYTLHEYYNLDNN
jgi:hypothetical protein